MIIYGITLILCAPLVLTVWLGYMFALRKGRRENRMPLAHERDWSKVTHPQELNLYRWDVRVPTPILAAKSEPESADDWRGEQRRVRFVDADENGGGFFVDENTGETLTDETAWHRIIA